MLNKETLSQQGQGFSNTCGGEATEIEPILGFTF